MSESQSNNADSVIADKAEKLADGYIQRAKLNNMPKRTKKVKMAPIQEDPPMPDDIPVVQEPNKPQPKTFDEQNANRLRMYDEMTEKLAKAHDSYMKRKTERKKTQIIKLLDKMGVLGLMTDEVYNDILETLK